MKSLFFLAATLIAFNSMAFESSNYSAFITFFSSGGNICKEAVLVMNDINNFNQSGEMSILLADKVSAVKNANPELSDAEAIDALLITSEKIIAENN